MQLLHSCTPEGVACEKSENECGNDDEDDK